MWGPANGLLEEHLSGDQRGLTPRVFELLFARLSEEQAKHAERQLKYQCRCSFLEIYNEQITDLLDPSLKNLMIREDVKSGVYVENLTEEYVKNLKDLSKLLVKGLANRRTGATSVNAESSRSHCVFTCVVESHCKSVADGLSSFKTSRINLVDLAGSERQKLTGAAGDRLKEAGNINRSLSQLGNLINILAEISQTGKQRHIPYRDSRLTFLLQESLGGNAKLAMVCAVSPSQR
jgi:kinesin family protein 15